MNLPSSLALPQSKFFQSRLGILFLALVVLAIAAGIFLMRRDAVERPVVPTVATSPAAPVKPGPGMNRPAVVYGPPAPEWAMPVEPYGPMPLAAAPVAQPTVGVATSAQAPAAAVPAAGAVATPAAPTAAIPLPTTGALEAPQSLGASVLFAREQYAYSSGGRRDPFQSLLDGKFQAQSGDGALVDVGDIHLVGIMWGSSDKFALVEDSRGHGYVLRVGDPVLNGYISGITKSELQVVQNAFGESQALSIHLQPKEGDNNGTRN
jgi:hypothetical protein